MTSTDPDPTSDELLAMAYADGELSASGRLELELRLAREPELARLVAEHQALIVVGRRAAPREPMDHEWARLRMDPLHRFGHLLGWVLFVGGSVGLSFWGVFEVARSSMGSLPKALVLALIGGFLVLFLLTVRARLRTLPYDPYVGVER